MWTQNFFRNYLTFTITFPILWRCACDFKALLKFKIAALDELYIFVCAKTPELKSEIIEIVQSHYPPYATVQVILLKFEMATTNRLLKYLCPQKLQPNLRWGMIRTSGFLFFVFKQMQK